MKPNAAGGAPISAHAPRPRLIAPPPGMLAALCALAALALPVSRCAHSPEADVLAARALPGERETWHAVPPERAKSRGAGSRIAGPKTGRDSPPVPQAHADSPLGSALYKVPRPVSEKRSLAALYERIDGMSSQTPGGNETTDTAPVFRTDGSWRTAAEDENLALSFRTDGSWRTVAGYENPALSFRTDGSSKVNFDDQTQYPLSVLNQRMGMLAPERNSSVISQPAAAKGAKAKTTVEGEIDTIADITAWSVSPVGQHMSAPAGDAQRDEEALFESIRAYLAGAEQQETRGGSPADVPVGPENDEAASASDSASDILSPNPLFLASLSPRNSIGNNRRTRHISLIRLGQPWESPADAFVADGRARIEQVERVLADYGACAEWPQAAEALTSGLADAIGLVPASPTGTNYPDDQAAVVVTAEELSAAVNDLALVLETKTAVFREETMREVESMLSLAQSALVQSCAQRDAVSFGANAALKRLADARERAETCLHGAHRAIGTYDGALSWLQTYKRAIEEVAAAAQAERAAHAMRLAAKRAVLSRLAAVALYSGVLEELEGAAERAHASEDEAAQDGAYWAKGERESVLAHIRAALFDARKHADALNARLRGEEDRLETAENDHVIARDLLAAALAERNAAVVSAFEHALLEGETDASHAHGRLVRRISRAEAALSVPRRRERAARADRKRLANSVGQLHTELDVAQRLARALEDQAAFVSAASSPGDVPAHVAGLLAELEAEARDADAHERECIQKREETVGVFVAANSRLTSARADAVRLHDAVLLRIVGPETEVTGVDLSTEEGKIRKMLADFPALDAPSDSDSADLPVLVQDLKVALHDAQTAEEDAAAALDEDDRAKAEIRRAADGARALRGLLSSASLISWIN